MIAILGRGLVPALVGAAFCLLAVGSSTAGTPLQDLSGDYAGKAKYRDQTLDPATEEGGAGAVLIGLHVGQDGKDTYSTMRVEGDEGAFFASGSGRAGNGRFWMALEDDDGGVFVLSGTARGTPGKRVIKAKGTYLQQDIYSDVKISLKEGDSGVPL